MMVVAMVMMMVVAMVRMMVMVAMVRMEVAMVMMMVVAMVMMMVVARVRMVVLNISENLQMNELKDDSGADEVETALVKTFSSFVEIVLTRLDHHYFQGRRHVLESQSYVRCSLRGVFDPG